MRRLAILGIGGALWLILAAIPALADGGPHVMSYNNGSNGINADGCASCHRIHSSPSPTGMLLTSADATVTEFCRSCHGASGTGASTDVDTGIQYALSGVARDTDTTIGALRGGGFIDARIASGDASRTLYYSSHGWSAKNSKIPVGTAEAVTSAHLAIGGAGGNGLTAKNVVWGNGALGTAGAGPTLAEEMECTACHNPHGNGNYRILNGIPDPGAEASGTFSPAAAAVNVTDATFDPERTRNYTVIQVAGTPTVESTYLLYADQVLQARADGTFNGIAGDYTALSGDYWHAIVPYNSATTPQWYDGPNARPNSSTTTAGAWNRTDPNGFNQQISTWCQTCHTRYFVASGGRTNDSGDDIFTYRHTAGGRNLACTTCHVAHGTDAIMNTDANVGTTYSANTPYPDGSTTVGNSRLLKVDNRGTCLLCHDPTSGSALPDGGVDTTQTLPQGPAVTLFP